jgi:hypothetical protein
MGSGENPIHTYTNTAFYYPTLRVINNAGLLPSTSGPSIKVGNPGAAAVQQVIINSPPQLALVINGETFALTWPTNSTGYTAQFTTSMMPPFNWMIMTSPPAIINGQNVVTGSVSGAQMFFRLEH